MIVAEMPAGERRQCCGSLQLSAALCIALCFAFCIAKAALTVPLNPVDRGLWQALSMDEQTTLTGKTPGESRLTLSRIMTQHDTNLVGTVHGGVIMKLVDSIAGVVSARHADGNVVTASMDEMDFLVAVRVGDIVHVRAQVNWAGSSSMEVGVRVTADRWNQSVPAVHVAGAYLVMVAVDDEGKPRRIPPLLIDTDEDARRNREALIRRSHRLARREAILESRRSTGHHGDH